MAKMVKNGNILSKMVRPVVHQGSVLGSVQWSVRLSVRPSVPDFWLAYNIQIILIRTTVDNPSARANLHNVMSLEILYWGETGTTFLLLRAS